MPPRRRTPTELFDAGIALIAASTAETRVRTAASEARIKLLLAADALERAGRKAEADRIYRQVAREQAALGDD
jgi:hypothetical protein